MGGIVGSRSVRVRVSADRARERRQGVSAARGWQVIATATVFRLDLRRAVRVLRAWRGRRGRGGGLAWHGSDAVVLELLLILRPFLSVAALAAEVEDC